MKTRVQKWGNSLAVRIPRAFARQTHLEANAPVDLEIVEGQIVIKPAEKPQYDLDDLLAGVTDDNQHEEIDMGTPAGNEIW